MRDQRTGRLSTAPAGASLLLALPAVLLPVALLAVAPLPTQALRLLGEPLDPADPTGPVLAVIGLLAWALVAWLCLGAVLVSAGRLPGLAGRLGAAAARRALPATVRRSLEVALGASLVVGTVGVSPAAATPAPLGDGPASTLLLPSPAAQSLDWPTTRGTTSTTSTAPAGTAPVGAAPMTTAADGATPSGRTPSGPTAPGTTAPSTTPPGTTAPSTTASGTAGDGLARRGTGSGAPGPGGADTVRTPGQAVAQGASGATTSGTAAGRPLGPGRLVQAGPASDRTASDRTAPEQAAREQAAAVRSEARTVVVQPGDTLWDLAARELAGTGPAGGTDGTGAGTDGEVTRAAVAARWPDWWAANRSAIGDDPHLLVPGTPLTPPGG